MLKFVDHLIPVESSVEGENNPPFLLHLTPIVTKVLLTSILKFEDIGVFICLDLMLGAFLCPMERKIILSIFKYFKVSRCSTALKS